ncbi:fibronectin type III domain-containing protein [Kribbella sp. NPDC055071]
MRARLHHILAALLTVTTLAVLTTTPARAATVDAPTNVHLSEVSFTWARLAWDAPASQLRYDVRLQGTAQQAVAFTPTQAFGGLEAGATYRATVQAIDANGNRSAPVGFTFETKPRVGPPPSAPTGLHTVSTGGRVAGLAWNVSQHTKPVHYQLAIDGAVVFATNQTNVSVRDLIVNECVEPGTHTFAIQAIDDDNYQSTFSNALTVAIGA